MLLIGLIQFQSIYALLSQISKCWELCVFGVLFFWLKNCKSVLLLLLNKMDIKSSPILNYLASQQHFRTPHGSKKCFHFFWVATKSRNMLWQKLLLQSTFVSPVRQQTISRWRCFLFIFSPPRLFFFYFFFPPHMFLSFDFLPPCNLGCCDCHSIWMRAKLYPKTFSSFVARSLWSHIFY